MAHIGMAIELNGLLPPPKLHLRTIVCLSSSRHDCVLTGVCEARVTPFLTWCCQSEPALRGLVEAAAKLL